MKNLKNLILAVVSIAFVGVSSGQQRAKAEKDVYDLGSTTVYGVPLDELAIRKGDPVKVSLVPGKTEIRLSDRAHAREDWHVVGRSGDILHLETLRSRNDPSFRDERVSLRVDDFFVLPSQYAVFKLGTFRSKLLPVNIMKNSKGALRWVILTSDYPEEE